MKAANVAILFAVLGLASCATKPVATVPVDTKLVEEVGAQHNHEVLLCYQDRLKTKADLVGPLVLQVNTDSSGSVTDVKVTKSLDDKFDRCVAGKAKTWKYPWLKQETLGMEDTFREYMNDNHEPQSDFAGPVRNSEKIRLALRSHLAEVRTCYESGLSANPRLTGKLVIQWDIDETGAVKAPQVNQSLAPKVDACIVSKLKTWKFPTPPNKMVSRVTFPFVFDSDPEKDTK